MSPPPLAPSGPRDTLTCPLVQGLGQAGAQGGGLPGPLGGKVGGMGDGPRGAEGQHGDAQARQAVTREVTETKASLVAQ